MSEAGRIILQLKDVHKTYTMGENKVHALRGVSLTIEEGDFVAIMGPSGSGKSTLMHLIGPLDVPTSGECWIGGQEVTRMTEDQLALLRRETVGFIFQQFNLLPRMSALENVLLPLFYSGSEDGLQRGTAVLEKVGLADRVSHRSNELSGGQQQRVAIARSLVNHPRMILADEPTGNLDSVSEKEIMDVLRDLNDQGITIVLVTHEEEIGQQAKRLIRMRDGRIQSDVRLREGLPGEGSAKSSRPERPAVSKEVGVRSVKVVEHFRQGFKTLANNKIRTGLSMLGILIGVAAVVAMLALGRGAQKAIESQLASLGSNLLVLRTGAFRMGGVAQEAGANTRLTFDDIQAIKDKVVSIKDASPNVNGRGQAAYQNKNWSTQILGTTSSYPRIHAAVPEVGRFFTDEENQQRFRVALLGTTVIKELFGEQNPVGEMIKINKVNFRVIGILPEKGATGWRDQDDIIIIPVLTAMKRLLGKDYVDNIDLEVNDTEQMSLAQDEILDLMHTRHHVPLSQQQNAFDIRNMADIQAALSETSHTMAVLLSSIAAISLLVGGIGIMNIMLVSVTERTREIGLRKAVGARGHDILVQFLAEAIVVSSVGGLLGIIIGWLITVVLSLVAGWTTSISISSILLSFFFSASVGVIFGMYPARRASLLHPIEALRYE